MFAIIKMDLGHWEAEFWNSLVYSIFNLHKNVSQSQVWSSKITNRIMHTFLVGMMQKEQMIVNKVSLGKETIAEKVKESF